jgi:radical SAM protein with 4Fe4S-binding SPASM domain
MIRKPSYLDVELYKRRLDEIDHLALHTKIQFTGVGEPLLHKNIYEMIRYAADKGFFTLMNSNASLLTPENSEKIVDSGLDYLHISIDGVRAETYEKIRRGGKFKLVLENIFNIFKARHKKCGYHLAVILGLIDQKANREEIKEFESIFGQFPFHHVVVGDLFNHMGSIEEANEVYSELNNQDAKNYPCCNTPWDLLSINSDGNAIACSYDFDNRYVIGDLNVDGFLQLWNKDRMLAFRKAVLDRNYKEVENKEVLCSACSIKWQKDYHLPVSFSSEIERMEEYLSRAIHRCARHIERNAKLRQKEKEALDSREILLDEILYGSRASKKH